jgi:UDP-glucose 4-epimerase
MADGTSLVLVTGGGDGTQRRDLVHVDDVVARILAAWRAGHNGPLILGPSDSVTVNDMVEAARSVTGAELPTEHVRPDPGRCRPSSSISRP